MFLNLGSVINYGDKMENVSCSSQQYMVIKKANYGDFNQNGVFIMMIKVLLVYAAQ